MFCSIGSIAGAQPAELNSIKTAKLSKVIAASVAQNDAITTLPHRWDIAYSGKSGEATYLIDLPAVTSTEAMAIFIPRVGNQARITLISNGIRSELAMLGKLGDDKTDSSKGPTWISLSPESIANAQAASSKGISNQLEISISAQAMRYAGLSTVYFGEASAVRPLYNQSYFWRNTLTIVTVLSLGLMGFVAAGIAWQQKDALFTIFAVAAILGMLRMVDRILPTPPLPWPLWGGVTAAAYACHIILLARLGVQVAGQWQPYLIKPFYFSLFISTVAAFSGFLLDLPIIWTATLYSLFIYGIYAVYSLTKSLIKSRTRENILILISSLAVVAAGARDLLLVRLALSSDITHSVVPQALLVLVMAMGWVVVERYSMQVKRYRSLNESLEERVADRERELEKTFVAIRQQSESNATLIERARIMRDIHDGVGAQLVGLLNAVKRNSHTEFNATSAEQIEQMASSALDELRMAVDALQPVNGDIATVLATLRYRLQQRLKDAGIEVIWNVEDLPLLDKLTPSAVLDIQRILLESFTNVIRHAQATQLKVSGGVIVSGDQTHSLIRLSVEDNGIGMSAGESEGHGIRNMKLRSKVVGANFSIESPMPGSANPGTRINLDWPTGDTV